uniref:CBM20 domain-containing protein n=1 Tax=Chromera velia CCMP2878 TaxID=1169474 RepID=A0A0G4I141_9ALVE|eukprot:Cvel_10064.t1-p1 / transcript=Cvel_10064.t1 / gene=Cvel_10064 / organism=Chromera_velia_CCMP2878 / gene_product=hypothetical protein / transcript_product=hypothetical protein / location=Cvel_scaffold599:343-1638(-) / protein_length=432 / sequence_SO=supercontig / SO=protein_coding / is_pseudo=false
MEAETGGGVVFACSGVEPREGQTLVVVGSSSELGGWDASCSVTLHRVKNPAFPGVWMSFPMFHSACSQVQFQFALVASSLSGGVRLTGGGSVIDGVQNSSAVTSAFRLAATPTDSRSQDGCGCLWEPLGCGTREVEVVDGGFVLFGGRWGEGETQVTPLTVKDMVLAQQQLEEDTRESVSSESNREREREGVGEGRGEGANLRASSGGEESTAGSERVRVCAPSVVASDSSSIHVLSEGEGGRGRESETDLPNRGIHLSRQEGECVGGVSLRVEPVGVGGVGVAAPSSENATILKASADSAECDAVCETSVCVKVQRRRDEVNQMGVRRGHDSEDASRLAPFDIGRKGGGVGGEEGGAVLGSKTAESVNGLVGVYDSVSGPGLLVGERQQMVSIEGGVFRGLQREGQSLCVSAACEGHQILASDPSPYPART